MNVSNGKNVARRTVLTKSLRERRARIAAHQSWANTDDRSARTRPGTRAFLRRFECQVAPDAVRDRGLFRVTERSLSMP